MPVADETAHSSPYPPRYEYLAHSHSSPEELEQAAKEQRRKRLQEIEKIESRDEWNVIVHYECDVCKLTKDLKLREQISKQLAKEVAMNVQGKFITCQPGCPGKMIAVDVELKHHWADWTKHERELMNI